jgi:hypothetical protein
MGLAEKWKPVKNGKLTEREAEVLGYHQGVLSVGGLAWVVLVSIRVRVLRETNVEPRPLAEIGIDCLLKCF